MFVNNSALVRIAVAVEDLVEIFRPRLSSTLTYLRRKGADNLATILVGKTASPVYQEWSGPNGTGDKLPPAGNVSYASSDSTVVSVDPASGAATGVALGSAQVTATDAANGLQATATINVTETAASATLDYTPNP